jgi:hypothetical protein
MYCNLTMSEWLKITDKKATPYLHQAVRAYEVARIEDSTFLGNRLTDGSEVLSLTRRPHFNPRKVSRTNFC